MATTNYRVNFGNGQVWYFASRKACADYIAAAKRDSYDPYAGSYYIERRDLDTGEWFLSRERRAVAA